MLLVADIICYLLDILQPEVHSTYSASCILKQNVKSVCMKLNITWSRGIRAFPELKKELLVGSVYVIMISVF